MAVGALGLISWETVLTAVSSHPAGSGLTLGVSLAYPISDLLVLMLVVLTLARAPGDRVSLSLVAAGCAALVLSDSLFAYLTAVTRYDGGAVDLGWMAAFVLLALAAVARERPAPDGSPVERDSGRRPGLAAQLRAGGRRPRRHPCAGRRRPSAERLPAGRAAAVVMTMLLRQHLMLRRNAELTAALAGREEQLLHQAFHDGLDRPGQPGALPATGSPTPSSCISGTCGRWPCCSWTSTTSSSSTTAWATAPETSSCSASPNASRERRVPVTPRLGSGGDEFAVLIEDDGDPVALASRIVNVLQNAVRPRRRDHRGAGEHRRLRARTERCAHHRRSAADPRRHGDVCGQALRQGPHRPLPQRHVAGRVRGRGTRAVTAVGPRQRRDCSWRTSRSSTSPQGRPPAVEALARWAHRRRDGLSDGLHPDGRALRVDGRADGLRARSRLSPAQRVERRARTPAQQRGGQRAAD